MEKKRVLVVEDTRMIANVIYDLLSPDYEVSLVYDGKEGAARALAEPFDLVVTDFMLPGINGGEVAKLIRQSGERGGIPIVALTSQSEKSVGAEYEGLFDSFLVKPFGLEELPKLVHKLLGDA